MIRRRHLRLLALCAVAAFPCLAAAHHTEPALWLNPLGGAFEDTTNWSVGIVPSMHDSVYFDLANPVYTTTFASSVQNVQLIVGGNDVTFDLLGSTYTVYDLAGIDVGHASPIPAIFRIRNGTVTSIVGASVGRTFSSMGILSLDGPSAGLTIAMDLLAGQRGNATIDIGNGAKLSDHNAYMATLNGSKSVVTISGADSRWDNTELHVGGTLVSSGELRIHGGTVSATSFIKIWRSGKIIYDGGQIDTPQLEIEGGTFSALGTFTPNFINRGGSIDVPSGQTLSLTGGLLSPNSDTLIKKGAGELVINGPQDHTPFSGLRVSAGKLVMNTNAGTAATATTSAIANLSLSLDPVAVAVTLNADQNLAKITVNESASEQQALDLASPADAGAFRSVRIADITTKADVWASIANANRPGAADPNDGIFDSGLTFHPGSAIGLATQLDEHGDPYLLIRPTRLGDLNLDGVVTISDIIDLASNFGSTTGTWQEGDLNYDGQVTISDFIDAAANFGSSYSAAAEAQIPNVPEPASLGLIFPVLMMARRRRK